MSSLDRVDSKLEAGKQVNFTVRDGFGSAASSQLTGKRFSEITTPGPIQKMDVPANWTKFDETPVRYGRAYHSRFSNPSHPDIGIGLDSAAVPVGPGGIALNNLLADPHGRIIYSSKWEQEVSGHANKEKERAGVKIATELKSVFGSSSVGDNQLLNKTDAISHLDKIEVKILSGRPVLATEGYLVDQKTGHPLIYFASIYMPVTVSGGGVEVHTVSYSAKDYESFLGNKFLYHNALSSIKWNKSGDQ